MIYEVEFNFCDLGKKVVEVEFKKPVSTNELMRKAKAQLFKECIIEHKVKKFSDVPPLPCFDEEKGEFNV